MNILVQGTANTTLSGFQRAAEAEGHTWIWWEENHTPAFDVFDDVKPDMLFCMENVSRATQKCVAEFNIPFVCGDSKQPFKFSVSNQMMDFERLVDAHIYHMVDEIDPALECDIGVVCEPCPLVLNLCRNIGEYNIKIMGDTPWSAIQYLGVGSMHDKARLYQSCRVAVVDSTLEMMRAIACGAIVVDTRDNHPQTLCGEEAVRTYANMMDITKLVKTTQDNMLPGHTYDDAFKTIMETIS